MRAAVLMLALVAAAPLRAEAPACVRDGVHLFPSPGSVVPVNVQWVLEGVGAEQARVADLVGATVALVPDDGAGAVQVKVERGWVSQVKRVAVRLRPLKPLRPGTRYTLTFGALLFGATLLGDPPPADGALTWTTGPGPDLDAPRFSARPGVAEGRYVAGLKEPEVRQLRLRLEVDERSPHYLLVTLKRMRGSSLTQQYPVAVEAGSAVLGHDACGGSFGWEDGRAYKASFELVDAAGNRSAPAALEVSAPKPARTPGR